MRRFLVLLPLACGCGGIEQNAPCGDPSTVPVGEYTVEGAGPDVHDLTGTRVTIEDELVTLYIEEDTGISTVTYAIDR